MLFVDNVFRFSQAGSEVSALLGSYALGRRLSADAGYRDGRAPGTHHLDQVWCGHQRAGDLRAGRRPDRPRPGHDLHPPGRVHRSGPRYQREGHLPGHRPARLVQPYPRRPVHRRAALQGCPAGAEHPAALPRPAGHHRYSRCGRTVRRRQAHRQPGPQDRAILLPAVLRGRAVHRFPRQLHPQGRHDPQLLRALRRQVGSSA